jgi:hypothetical protein
MMKSLILLLFLIGSVANVYSDSLKAQHIDTLYEEADFVGYVKILSGEFKEYTGAVYKAKILKVLKGNPTEMEIYLGPFSGYSIGSEYLLFARKTGKTLEDHWGGTAQPMLSQPYSATAQYFNIMFEGFGMIPIKYIVGLDGYGIETVSHIKLPSTLKDNLVRAENKTWLSKDILVKYLESLGRNTIKKVR